MSALFGHVKGAFTGAVRDRRGHLRAADGGVLFLDEIGSLGLDEQAMLLHALEEKVFFPLGGDREVKSDFQLVAGTNSDLKNAVEDRQFREDLLARINLWTFRLPGLRDRIEDIEPNLQYELDQYAERHGKRITFNHEARLKFLKFAASPQAVWTGNFRDLNGAIIRMATLAPGGRISVETVEEEIARLKSGWQSRSTTEGDTVIQRVLGVQRADELDQFESAQLACVLAVSQRAHSLSEAGRILFGASRTRKKSTNDADRLRKYLARFGIEWSQIKELLGGDKR